MRNPIIAALDVPTAELALKLVREIAPAVGAFKIGSELFTVAGPDIVKKIRATGASVFLDLKFHDIPNTVTKAVTAAVQLDVQMLTVHTSGGFEMLRAAEQAAEEVAWKFGRIPPLVLGVTVLTSLNAGALREIGLDVNVEYQVRRLAAVATKAGLRGLVCSPQEVVKLRQEIPPAMQLVTPGIRTGAEKADDQKRTLTPKEAIAAGANWLVIGRPIYEAENPRAAAEKILESIS
jgi:orotidine-5'-phosphate decarboxylase